MFLINPRAVQRPITRLTIGLAMIVVLLLAVAATSIIRIHLLQTDFENLIDQHILKIDIVNNMRAIMRDRMVAMTSMLIQTDVFDRDETALSYGVLAGRFLSLRQMLEAMPQTLEENQALSELRRLTIEVTPINDRIVFLLNENKIKQAHELLLSSGLAEQQRVLRQVDVILVLYKNDAQRVESDTQHYTATTIILLVGLTIVATILSLLIAIHVIRRTRHDRNMLLSEITERERAEQGLRLQHQAVEASINAIFIIRNKSGGYLIEYVNPSFERITGYNRNEVMGKSLSFLYAEDSEQPGIERIHTALREQREANAILRNYHKEGRLIWNELHIAPVRDSAARISHFVGIMNDITEKKYYEQGLEHQSTHDTLTALANRVLLLDRMQQAIASAARQKTQVCVAFFDLDRFKVINDSLGHAVGDEVLKTIASRLQSCVRADDTVARLGGDEFVIIFRDQGPNEQITQSIERILVVIANPIIVEQRELFITASVGLSVYPQDGEESEILLKNADIAMYRAKDAGRNLYFYFTEEMNGRATKRLLIENGLRQALENNEFVLHYQPMIDVQTSLITGAEVLIRWQHPVLGLLAPAQFIGIAEETGLIVPIGNWVLQTACSQAVTWQRRGLPWRISVNISARQFRDDQLFTKIDSLVKNSGLDPARLEVELTENIVMSQAEEFVGTMLRFKKLGIMIAIDDFGTGYSSLAYLKQFPIDRLKLDKSFVHDIHLDPNDAAIVQAVISLGHTLGLKVIAEGVESELQLAFLKAHGCDEVQGNFFSNPVPIEQFDHLPPVVNQQLG